MMLIDSKTRATKPANRRGLPKRTAEENDPGDRVSLSSIGSAALKGAASTVGLVNAALAAPSNLIAGALHRPPPDHETAMGLAAFSYPISISLGIAGGLIAGAPFALSLIGASSLTTILRFNSMSEESMKKIVDSRTTAKESTEGSEAKKIGAGYAAGVATGFKESFDRGAGAVYATTDFIGGLIGWSQQGSKK